MEMKHKFSNNCAMCLIMKTFSKKQETKEEVKRRRQEENIKMDNVSKMINSSELIVDDEYTQLYRLNSNFDIEKVKDIEYVSIGTGKLKYFIYHLPHLKIVSNDEFIEMLLDKNSNFPLKEIRHQKLLSKDRHVKSESYL